MKTTLYFGAVRLTVDADLVAAHPLLRSSSLKPQASRLPQVGIVCAIELLEAQWQRDHEGVAPRQATATGDVLTTYNE